MTTKTVSDTGNQQLAEVPTVVLCHGDGAIEEGRELLRLAESLGIADRLCLIALNTRADAYNTLPDTFHRIVLELPDERYHSRDLQARRYIDPDVGLREMVGARRNRPVGRYYVDNAENLANVEAKIQSIVRNFVERFTEDPDVTGPEVVNVFQMAAGGGGTGSGVLPLMIGMVDTITDELESVVDVGFYQWTIATLATVENFHSDGRAPDINWRYLGNSLALLEELQALTGEADVQYPMEIPLVGAEDAGLQRDAYRLSHNPLEGVYLLRYEEDTAIDNDEYKRGIDRTVASTVLMWMRQDADGEGVENEIEKLDDTFMELRAATFQTPTEAMRDLLDAQDDAEMAQSKLNEQTARQTELTAAIEQLDAILDAKEAFKTGNLDISTEVVDDAVMEPVRKAFTRCWTVSGNVDVTSLHEQVVDEWLEELRSQREFSFHDLVDGERLFEMCFLAALETRVERAVDGHAFVQEIHTFVDSHEDAIVEFDATFDPDAEPEVQWSDSIEPLLSAQLEELRAELEGMSLTDRMDRSRVRKLKSEIASTEEKLSELQSLATERDQLVQTAEALSERREDCEADLTARRATLRQERSDVEDEIEVLDQRIESAEDRIDRYSSEALASSLGRFVTLPVTSDAQVTDDLVAEDPGITALVEQGIVDRGTVVDLFRKLLRGTDKDQLEDQLESRANGERSPPRGMPYMFCSEETRELLWHDAPTGPAPATVADNQFQGDPRTVISTDDRRATLLVVYRNLCPDDFDHGILRDSFEEGQAMLFGESVELASCYAYPELLPRDHPLFDQKTDTDVSVTAPGEVDD